jgi:hypothetical protein
MPSAGLRTAVAGLFVVAMLAAATVAAQAGPIVRGVYADRPQGDDPTNNLVYERIAAAGASIARFTVTWRDMVPAKLPAAWDPKSPADTSYAWGNLDSELRLAVANGLSPLVTILGAPAWAQEGHVADDLSSTNPSPKALAAFATAMARRYNGKFEGLPRVRYWQAWNEPNITAYLVPQWSKKGADVSPDWYRQMLNSFADAIHAAAPGNVVVSAGLAPFTVNYASVKSIGPLRFMRELLCMSAGAHPHPVCNAKVKFDIWAQHPYTSGGPFHHAARPDDVSLGDLPKVKTLLQAAARAGHIVSQGPVRFWVTEFSWDTNPPDKHGVPVALHARWTAEALHQMWLSGVSAVVWLMLRDDPYPSSPLQAGLFYRGNTIANDRPKPALTAFEFPFVAYLNSGRISVWGETPHQQAGVIAIERRRSGSSAWQRIATLRTQAGVFKATLRVAATPRDWLRAQLLGSSTRSLAFSLTVPRDLAVNPFG